MQLFLKFAHRESNPLRKRCHVDSDHTGFRCFAVGIKDSDQPKATDHNIRYLSLNTNHGVAFNLKIQIEPAGIAVSSMGAGSYLGSGDHNDTTGVIDVHSKLRAALNVLGTVGNDETIVGDFGTVKLPVAVVDRSRSTTCG